jgi:hypothetical protein
MRLQSACALVALSLTAVAASPASAAAQFFGPTPYLSSADSPFAPASHTQFYLEDFEDGLLNTPGLSATGLGQVCVSNLTGCFLHVGLEDSVGNGGDANVGHSLFSGGGSLTLTFDAAALGALPTAAGLVWTDGADPIVFEAFDQNGVSLGTITGNSADGDFAGGTGEDRFYGVTNASGISKLIISDNSGIEIDHVQYGVDVPAPGGGPGGVPEPASWALMLCGFFGAGGLLRARRRSLQLA